MFQKSPFYPERQLRLRKYLMDAGYRIFFITVSQKVLTVPFHRILANRISQSLPTADTAPAVLKKNKFVKPSPYHSYPCWSSNISDYGKKTFGQGAGYVREGVLEWDDGEANFKLCKFSVSDHMKQNEESMMVAAWISQSSSGWGPTHRFREIPRASYRSFHLDTLIRQE